MKENAKNMHEKPPIILLTGGHLAPLLALLEVFQKTADCVVVGREYSFEKDKTPALEYQIIKEKGIPFYPLRAARLQRRFSGQTIPSLLKLPFSFLTAHKLLRKVKPDAVLTFGGYMSVPVAFAAYSLGIPVVVHEQTHGAGLANRIIGRFAQKICVSFASSEKYFPTDKVVITGNPVRRDVFMVKDAFDSPKNVPVLLVMGGSTGAHTINTYVEYLLTALLKKFAVIHQTGDSREHKDFDRLTKDKNRLPEDLRKRYILKKFILPSEIGFAYKLADVVLARSGANTVAELLALHKKALLIPLPHGQNNEQLQNARHYASSELGGYIEEKNIHLEGLVGELETLLKRKDPQYNKTFFEKNAAEKIANAVFETIS